MKNLPNPCFVGGGLNPILKLIRFPEWKLRKENEQT